ncbi:chondroadherin-like protein [Esox lucius]|uniref:Chondroadherin-like protein n=1 Tax=Esox lucius TaxID=8010 RepID=A0A3P8ZN82_ESOLU|nr:chondroadherin-like protein [Esox lucius]
MWYAVNWSSAWLTWVFILLDTLSPAQAGKCPKVCICDNSKLIVACINKNLTQVPATIDEITVKLDLSKNDIQVLPVNAFLHTPHLTHLTLRRCNIRTIREGAFRTLGRLVYLNLANNNIEILYQESFDGLSSLKQLTLDHNRVEEIQPGAFTQLGVLNMLSLTHNQLVYMPNMAFQGLHNIKGLHLGYNSLNNLAPEAFAGLFTLTRLSLDHNELQFFPTQTMTRLVEVTRLDLSYNPITYLGEDAVSMPKLAYLYLDHISLQDLSDTAMSQAPLLSHLDLSHNQLRYMEPLSGPKELARLNLTGNPINCNCYLRPLKEWAKKGKVKLLGVCAGPPHLTDESLEAVGPLELRCRSREDMIKEEFEEHEESRERALPTAKPKERSKCPSNCDCNVEAQHATCENRGHTKVPRGFPSNTQLLDLRRNHFHFLPTKSFPGTGHVVSLHLEHCKIHEIDGSAFQGMKALVYLYLSDNDLTSLSPGTFTGAPELTYLHLEGNWLATFPGAALAPLSSLLVLHLERNTMSKLDQEGLLSSVPKLRGLYLTNNTLSIIAPGALNSAHLDTLHLGSNLLSEVPTDGLSKASSLAKLHLSGNPIRWVGPKAFLPVSKCLKQLYMDEMGLEKMSQDSLAGLGYGLTTLSLERNQLEGLPDLSPLIGLEVLNLAQNPLLCDCTLLPLRRWMENMTMKVTATCGHPPELWDQSVRDVHVFNNCSSISPGRPLKGLKTPKSIKPKLTLQKMTKAKAMPGRFQPKPTKPGRVKPNPKALPLKNPQALASRKDKKTL